MYRFVVVGFPETFYLKSVKMGDLDVTRAAIPVPGDPLTVIVSAKGAEVSGTAARDGLSVVLWPENDNPWHPTHGIRIVNSSKGGSFALRGLAPGKYRAAVFETPETGVLYNYEFLSKFANEAAKVEVLEGAKVKAEPPLIPAARFKAEFEKLP
jgi:hypothetical protein